MDLREGGHGSFGKEDTELEIYLRDRTHDLVIWPEDARERLMSRILNQVTSQDGSPSQKNELLEDKEDGKMWKKHGPKPVLSLI